MRECDARAKGDAVPPLPHHEHRHRIRAGPSHRVADLRARRSGRWPDLAIRTHARRWRNVGARNLGRLSRKTEADGHRRLDAATNRTWHGRNPAADRRAARKLVLAHGFGRMARALE